MACYKHAYCVCLIKYLSPLFSDFDYTMSLVNKYKCKMCEFSCGQFTEIIDHRIIRHPDEEIKIRKFVGKDSANATLWLTRNFPVTPTIVKNNSCFIYSEPTREKVKVAPRVPRSDECKIKTPPALEGLIGGHTTY